MNPEYSTGGRNSSKNDIDTLNHTRVGEGQPYKHSLHDIDTSVYDDLGSN